MDQLFDRLGNLLRSVFQDGGESFDPWKGKFSDPDEEEAWEELNEYLNEASPGGSKSSSTSPGGGGTGFSWDSGTGTAYSRTDGSKAVPEELRSDYSALEVPFGASMEEVKRSYRRLLQIHHPDRHADNPDSQNRATERTQQITYSFLRIKKFNQKGHL